MPVPNDDSWLRSAAPPSNDLEARRARLAVAERLFGPSRDDAPPRLGRYEIRGRLGAGAMGVVYRAYDPDLDREVALKLLLGERRRDGEAAAEARARLLREARAMARLSHPNVIAVYDVGVEDGDVFVAMELVEGEDLRTHLAHRDLPWDRIVDLFVQAADGLSAAHGAGVVHRDFKPENVLVGRDGRVRVSDFGLAGGRLSNDAEPAAAPDADDDDLTLTRVGSVLGTPKYMAPEQFRDATAATFASDQFSFCVALFEALFGRPPFDGETLMAYREAAERGAIARVDDRHVPDAVVKVLRRGLDPAPDRRYPSMEALARALRGTTRLSRMRRRIAIRAGASLAVAAGAVAAVALALGRPVQPDAEPVEKPAAAGGKTGPVAPSPDAGGRNVPAPPSRAATGGAAPVASALADVDAGDAGGGSPSPAPTTAPPSPSPPQQARATEARRPRYRACYYNDRNKLLGKRRRHATFVRLEGTCHRCARKLRTTDLAGLRDADACAAHYACVPAPEDACGG
ncbi:MAG: serine/threonine protein kinase [Deltaproteobacteria bacterium]|nr:MAG: serine/threonine protein kinase [Deltaproteobacteria bacterium]